MKKRIELVTAFLTLLFLLVSCDNSESPNDLQTMLLKTSASKDYCQFYDDPLANSLYCSAYITDGNDFVDVSSIYANNFKCENMGGAVGQYMGLLPSYPDGPPYNIRWVIKGWMGKDFDIAQPLSNKLDFVNLHYLDTIYAGEDLKITYSGAANNDDEIDIRIIPATGENFYFFNIINLEKNVDYDTSVKDNGTIVIPSAIFSSFEKNRYYSIGISNASFERDEINNYTIIKKSNYTVTTAIYLIQ